MCAYFKTIILEIRPLLQSINFTVQLKEEDPLIRIELENQRVIIIFNEIPYYINLENIDILKDSVTNQQIVGKYLTFRIATNTINKGGSFKTELLQIGKSKNSVIAHNNAPKANHYYSIYCTKCNNEFVSSNIFERVLPLPSEDCSPEDWFCHKTKNETINLAPNLEDLFYSQCFMHVNSKLLNGIVCSEAVLKCNTCHTWLGVTTTKGTYKLWFNTTTLKSDVENFASDPLQDVFDLLRNFQTNNLLTSNRHILYCPIAHGKACNLLLWIVEKSLIINIYEENSGKKEYKTCKVLYKIEYENTKELETWQKNVNISNTVISKKMLESIIRHFENMQKYIPDSLHKTNNFYVSYLLMYNKQI